MKKVILFILIISAFQISAQDIIWISPTEYDFGILEQFNPEQVEFKFKNNTDRPITVDNVRTSCGCTSPGWTEEPIMPDSVSVITVEYDARKTGYFYKKAKVYFSGIRKGHKLYVEGEVVDKL